MYFRPTGYRALRFVVLSHCVDGSSLQRQCKADRIRQWIQVLYEGGERSSVRFRGVFNNLFFLKRIRLFRYCSHLSVGKKRTSLETKSQSLGLQIFICSATSAQFRLSCLVSLPCLIKDLVVLGLCSEIGIWMWSVPNQGSRGGAPSCPFQTVPPTEDQVFDHMGGHSHSNHHIILPGNSQKQEETSFQILLFFGCTSIFVAAT